LLFVIARSIGDEAIQLARLAMDCFAALIRATLSHKGLA